MSDVDFPGRNIKDSRKSERSGLLITCALVMVTLFCFSILLRL